jgi:hypothetical protein
MTRTTTPILQKNSILPKMPIIRETKPNIIMPVPPVGCVVRGNYQGKGREISRRRGTPNASAPASRLPHTTNTTGAAEQVVSQCSALSPSNRRDPHQPGPAPGAPDVVSGRVAEPAVHLHRGVRGREGCVGGEELGYVRLLTAPLVAWSLSIRQAARRMASSAAESRA